jgi:septum formation protein
VDTVVALEGRIHGKPLSEEEARGFLGALSGQTHEVWSGIALVEAGRIRQGEDMTEVTFRTLDEPTVDWYLATGEWRDRAGGYAIQGRGAALVERIEGDYATVVGLPVARLIELAPELLGGS